MQGNSYTMVNWNTAHSLTSKKYGRSAILSCGVLSLVVLASSYFWADIFTKETYKTRLYGPPNQN